MDSTSVITVAPVVVKPDIHSKKASVKEGNTPLNIKGNEANAERLIQLQTTIRKPSVLPIFLRFSLTGIIKGTKPATKVIKTDNRIAVKPYSGLNKVDKSILKSPSYIALNTNDVAIRNDSKIVIPPITLEIILKSTVLNFVAIILHLKN